MSTDQRLRLVIFQEVPGLWVVRGLEHDVAAEARSIGEAMRAVVRLIEAHSQFDLRHDRMPLAAFRPAPQTYWNAFRTGTPVSLAQFGIAMPLFWSVAVSVAHYRPSEGRLPWPAPVQATA